MKKVLFMCINMNIGGTEKALLTMLNEMDSTSIVDEKSDSISDKESL